MILWPKSLKNCTANSLIGPKVFKAIGWNMCNAAYYACFLDATISAAAPAEDAEAENVWLCQRGSDCNIICEGQSSLPRYQRQALRAFAVTTKETISFLRDWNFWLRQAHVRWCRWGHDALWFDCVPFIHDCVEAQYRQVCAAHRPRPSRKATATRAASSSRPRPH